MENVTILLLASTNILIVAVLCVLAFLIYRLLKEDRKPQTPTNSPFNQYHPAIRDRIKEADKLKPTNSELFCPNHPQEPGETSCAICDRLFCRACNKPFKSLHFCKEHLPLVMRHDWQEVMTLKTSTENPEEGVRLYQRKREIFERDSVPTYVETHYKIDVDHDHIETYLVVFAIHDQVEATRDKFRDL